MQRIRLRYRKAYMTIIASYLCIVLVTLLFNVAFAYVSNQTFEREIITANANALHQFRVLMDTQLREVEAYAYQIASDAEVQNIAMQQRNRGLPEFQYALAQICKNQLGWRPNDSLIHTRYIWLMDAGYVLTEKGTYSEEEFIRGLRKRGLSIDSEWVWEMNRTSLWNEYRVIPVEDGHQQPVLQVGVVSANAGWMKRAVVGVLLDRNILATSIESSAWLENSSVSILDSERNCLFAYNIKDYGMARIYGQQWHAEQDHWMSINGRPCYVMEECSMVNGWRYLSITPLDAMMATRDRMVRMSILFALAALMIAVVLCVFIARKQYEPLKRMVHKLGGENASNVRNEYHFLEASISEIISEKDTLKLSLEKKVNYLRDSGLIQLLLEQVVNPNEAKSLLEECGVILPEKAFCIISAYVLREENEEEEDFWLILRDMLDIILTKRELKHYIFKLRDRMIALVNMAPDQSVGGQLVQDCREIAEMMKAKLNKLPIVVVSQEGIGISSLPTLYQQVLEVDGYLTFLQIGGVSLYEESYNMNHALAIITQEDEVKLRNLLANAEYEEAELKYRDILLKLFDTDNATLSMLRYRLFKLLDTISRIVIDLRPDAFQQAVNIVQPGAQWLACDTISELRERLDELFLNVVDHLNKNTTDTGEVGLIRRAKAVVAEQYASADLSVQSLARHLGVGQTTLSRAFKQSMDVSVLDYIHSYRLTVAKQLMHEENYGIQEIAERVGFCNSVTFIRVFKKYEGITPGAFKKINRQ